MNPFHKDASQFAAEFNKQMKKIGSHDSETIRKEFNKETRRALKDKKQKHKAQKMARKRNRK